MSRMSELSGCIADLKAAAAALISAAETLTELYSGEEPAQDRPESRAYHQRGSPGGAGCQDHRGLRIAGTHPAQEVRRGTAFGS